MLGINNLSVWWSLLHIYIPGVVGGISLISILRLYILCCKASSLRSFSTIILFSPFYWAEFVAPTSPTPPFRIRKTATAPGSPYSFRIVRGFFYVPQNYQHSRNCETGPPAYRPYPRRLQSLTICRWNYKGTTK